MRRPGQTATGEELQGAALQFVRKISGYNKPSRANQEAWDRALREITEASARLMSAIEAQVGSPRNPLPPTTRDTASEIGNPTNNM